jgi:hypothetical protein
MSPHTASVMTLPEAEQPASAPEQQLPARQVPAGLRLAQPQESRAGGARPVRPLDVAECALCGFTHPLGLMVPDGGSACADVKWYCKDTRSCTERWVMARAHAAHSGTQPGDDRPLSAAS